MKATLRTKSRPNRQFTTLQFRPSRKAFSLRLSTLVARFRFSGRKIQNKFQSHLLTVLHIQINNSLIFGHIKILSILVDIVDPFATVAARHFRQLMSRHGAPIIIVNLVKMREKKAQESMLAEEYKICLDYLKQFLPNENFIEYICFDMAKLNKT